MHALFTSTEDRNRTTLALPVHKSRWCTKSFSSSIYTDRLILTCLHLFRSFEVSIFIPPSLDRDIFFFLPPSILSFAHYIFSPLAFVHRIFFQLFFIAHQPVPSTATKLCFVFKERFASVLLQPNLFCV